MSKKKRPVPTDDHAPIPCPECGASVPVDPAALVARTEVRCPSCGLELTLDPSATRRGMAAWQDARGSLAALKATLPKG